MANSDFFADATPMVTTLDDFVRQHGLVGKAQADHLCYKCASSGSFEAIRRSFENDSAFIYQSIISKRRIAIIRFRDPVETALGPISVLELSDQKPDNSQTEGFDHIEIFPTVGGADDLVGHIRSQGTDIETIVRPHHTTHDVTLGGYKIRIEEEPLLDKIKREEMQ